MGAGSSDLREFRFPWISGMEWDVNWAKSLGMMISWKMVEAISCLSVNINI